MYKLEVMKWFSNDREMMCYSCVTLNLIFQCDIWGTQDSTSRCSHFKTLTEHSQNFWAYKNTAPVIF